MKKEKRNAWFGLPVGPEDRNDPDFKVVKCSFCEKEIILLSRDWKKTSEPEKVPRFCMSCVYLCNPS